MAAVQKAVSFGIVGEDFLLVGDGIALAL